MPTSVANTRSIVEYLDLDRRRRPDGRSALLLRHGEVPSQYSHFSVGGTIVINNKFAYTASVLKQMAEEKVTGFSGVPSTYAQLLFKSPLAEYRDQLAELFGIARRPAGTWPGASSSRSSMILPPQTAIDHHVWRHGSLGPIDVSSSGIACEAKIDSIGMGHPGRDAGRPVLRRPGPRPSAKPASWSPGGQHHARLFSATRKRPAGSIDRHGYHTGDIGYQRSRTASFS
ncbi:MAG: hypothetical protein MZU79_07075 [Anaerotruncus sp.]|nr:hypothetical protein [Anaerotruncus sp.]